MYISLETIKGYILQNNTLPLSDRIKLLQANTDEEIVQCIENLSKLCDAPKGLYDKMKNWNNGK